eukprot:948471-Rhodomonas_salina.3
MVTLARSGVVWTQGHGQQRGWTLGTWGRGARYLGRHVPSQPTSGSAGRDMTWVSFETVKLQLET